MPLVSTELISLIYFNLLNGLIKRNLMTEKMVSVLCIYQNDFIYLCQCAFSDDLATARGQQEVEKESEI